MKGLNNIFKTTILFVMQSVMLTTTVAAQGIWEDTGAEIVGIAETGYIGTVIYGDIDNDGDFDEDDLQLLQKIYLGLESSDIRTVLAADVDLDGEITGKDLAQLKKYLTGDISLDIIAYGTCGDDITWTLSDSYTLTVTGTGDMSNYSSSEPWCYNEQIRNVVIEEGVESIGNYAFNTCSALRSITLPESLTQIDAYAFFGCARLNDIYYNGSKLDWRNVNVESGNTPLLDAELHYAKEYIPEKVFTMLRDNYSFANMKSSFGYSDTYRIPLERYIAVYGVTEGVQKYYRSSKLWRGSCYGFAATSALFYDELMDYNLYDESAEDLYDISAPKSPISDLTIFMESYQISQGLDSLTTERYRYINNFDAVIEAVEYFEITGENPVILCMSGEYGGHAVIPYKCQQNSDGSYSIYVYDNNYPSSLYRTMRINKNLDGFYYDGYDKSLSFNYADTVYNAMYGVSLMSGGSNLTVTVKSADIELTDQNGTDISDISGAYEVLPIEEGYDPTLKTYIVPAGDYIIKNNSNDIDSLEVSVANEFDCQLVSTDDIYAEISIGVADTGRVYSYINSVPNSRNCIQMIGSTGVSKRLNSLGSSLGVVADNDNKAQVAADSFVLCNGASVALGGSGILATGAVSTEAEYGSDSVDDDCTISVSENTLKYSNGSIDGTLSFMMYNNTKTVIAPQIIVSLYSADGTLVSILKNEEEILGIGSNYIDLGTITCPVDEEAGYYIKCYAWDSIDEMIPLGGFSLYKNLKYLKWSDII